MIHIHFFHPPHHPPQTETSASAITRIFGGQLRSVLRCPGQKDSVTLEPYMSLQLEIQVSPTFFWRFVSLLCVMR